MLVLSRRQGEEIIISVGDKEILVKVKEIRRGQVSIGVKAPMSVEILRAELRSNGGAEDE